MKKHILFLMTAIFTAGILLSSCSNLFDVEKSDSANGGKILLSLGLANPDGSESIQNNNARTVMAYSSDNGTGSLSEISLYSKSSSASDYTLLASWDSVTAMQRSPYSGSLTSGTYDFKLTAKNYGATMLQELKSKTVSASGTTSLAFTALAPSSEGAQTGGIYVDAEYKNTSYTDYVAESLEDFAPTNSAPYPVYAVKLDSGEVLATTSSEPTKEVSGSDGSVCKFYYSGYSYFSNNAVPAGNHILTYTFTSPDGKVFVYPVAVQVKAGYLSKATIYPLYDTSSAILSGTSYTLTYNANTGSSSSTASQTFAGTASIADAQALGFTSSDSSKRFKYWTTDAAGNGTKYYSGDTLSLTGDTTLYAQWGTFYKVSYFINIDGKTDTYIQQFESGDSLVASSTAFADFDSSKYTFCGYDTGADGSGTRYAENAKPSITEDTVLYAQWCGAKSTLSLYSDYYTVKDAAQWNALMGAPFANTTSGTISVNAYISSSSITIQNPAASLTSSKTFSGKIYCLGTITGLSGVLFDTVAEGAEITGASIKGPVCNKNNGTIKSVYVSGLTMTGWSGIAKTNSSTGTISSCTVSSCTITGSGDYAGAICGLNEGTLENCTVSNCTVNGSAKNVKYTGGLCGYNSGTISGAGTKVTGTVTGSSADETFAGGFCAYNTGTISDAGSVDITLSGSSEENSHYGYVIGYNNGGTVSTEITTTAQEILWDSGTVEVDKELSKTITLERTSLVTFIATDTDANAAQLNAYIKNSNGYYISVFSTQDIKSTSVTKKAYLSKGLYTVYLTEDYITKNTGCSAVVKID